MAPLSPVGEACAWACRHRDWINGGVRAEPWDDARLDAELDRVDAVFDRAAREPSRSLADLSAKARLVLGDVLEHTLMDDACPDEKLLVVVLREVVALAPPTGEDAR